MAVVLSVKWHFISFYLDNRFTRYCFLYNVARTTSFNLCVEVRLDLQLICAKSLMFLKYLETFS